MKDETGEVKVVANDEIFYVERCRSPGVWDILGAYEDERAAEAAVKKYRLDSNPTLGIGY